MPGSRDTAGTRTGGDAGPRPRTWRPSRPGAESRSGRTTTTRMLASRAALRHAGVDSRQRRIRRAASSGAMRRATRRASSTRPPRSSSRSTCRSWAWRTSNAAWFAVAQELLALGVVAVHDPGGLAPDRDLDWSFAAYRHLADTGRLPDPCPRVAAGGRVGRGDRAGHPKRDDPRRRPPTDGPGSAG